jgi:hypothetical protein
MNKQQAMNWFDSKYCAGTVTRNIISEMFDDLELVEPEEFMPTVGLTYQFSNSSDFIPRFELKLTDFYPRHAIRYDTEHEDFAHCRPVPAEMRHKYGE